MKIQFRVTSWQALIQQTIYYISRGYYYYHYVEYPEKKRDKWNRIDTKLVKKYSLDLSKFQRAYRKKKGLANYTILRHEGKTILFHTDGEMPEIQDKDAFIDIREVPLCLKISSVTLEVYIDKQTGKTSLRMEKSFYRGVKAEVLGHIEARKVWVAARTFDALNGLPAWKGIIQQKMILSKFIARMAKRHQQKAPKLRINTVRRPVKAF